MSPLLETVLVGLIVAVAAGFSAWRLMPARTRQALARRLDPLLARLGLSRARTAPGAPRGVHGCDHCPPAAQPNRKPR